MKDMPAVPSKKDEKSGPDKWEIDQWCNTVMEAEEIKADKEKMKHVQAKLAKKQKAMGAVMSMADLRERAKKYSKDGEGDA